MCPKILLSQQVMSIKIIGTFSFVTKSLKSSVYFYPYGTTQFGLVTFQVLNSHMWVSGVVVEGASLVYCNILVIISVLRFLSYSFHQETLKANSSVFLVLTGWSLI